MEHLEALAVGCDVHGVGFICRHDWADMEGQVVENTLELNAARARLAEAALKVIAEPRP